MTRPRIVETTTVVNISIKKFQPMNPTIRNVIILANDSSPAPPAKIGLKKIKQIAEKRPVLIMGTRILAKIIPSNWFLFFSALYMKPATRPASVVLSRHAATVPKGLTGINIAIVDGENKTITPQKKPNIAPDKGPYKTAASTMATNERLILTGPNCK